MKNIIFYFRGVMAEMKLVTWPKREEVTRLTLVVIIFSAIVAGYLGGLDFLFTKILETVLLS